MNTLINKTTGQVVVYKKVSRDDEKVYYTLYDNGVCYAKGKFLEDTFVAFDKTKVCPFPATYLEFRDYIGLQTIKDIFSGFEEGDPTNWVFDTGSTGEKTTLRVLIPSDLIGKEMYTGSPLDQLVQAMSPLAPWTTRGEVSVIQYLLYLLPEHKSILDMYASKGVIIEDRVFPQYEVRFNVFKNDSPLEGAIVNIDSETLIADESGIVTITLKEGSYPYIVTDPSDNSEITGTAIVVDQNVQFTINF